jgi:XTP/dITP diphosphohydrolase
MDMKLVLASRNQKKIGELRTMLQEHFPGVEVLSLDDIGYEGDIEENGTTFEENALTKARVAASSGYIGIADDSGITVDALNGEPGVYSARFAAMHNYAGGHDDEANNQLLLELLRDTPEEKRGAAYVCCVACVMPDGSSFTVRGEVRGRLLREYHGTGGFGYDPLFYYEPFGKTFAEVPAEDKHSVSHRGEAMKKFAEKLKSLL